MQSNVKVKTVTDDNGIRWIVNEGDPGWEIMQIAKQLRLENPTFPHELLLGRPVLEADWKAFEEHIKHEHWEVERARSLYTVAVLRERAKHAV